MDGTRNAASKTVGRSTLVLALLFALAASVPVGVYLQWSAPGDFPARVCIYPSIGAVLLAGAWILRRQGRAAAEGGWPMRAGAAGLFALSFVVLVATSVPPIGRRVGPWAELRRLLVAKSREVAEARAALGIPEDRYLTSGEMREIETLVLEPAPEYTFPIIHRTVRVSMLRAAPPYVGVDFGGGRRAVFDLRTMVILYAD
jgi:hypothetical protein